MNELHIFVLICNYDECFCFSLKRDASPHHALSQGSEKCVKALVAQSCLTLCNPVDCSLPGSSLHGILQARILEWLPFPSPGGLPDPGIEPVSPALLADSLLAKFGPCKRSLSLQFRTIQKGHLSLDFMELAKSLLWLHLSSVSHSA